jgi:hypothetical protein
MKKLHLLFLLVTSQVSIFSASAQQSTYAVHRAVGSQLKNTAILEVDLKKIICEKLPGYIFVAGDHKMAVGTLTTSSLMSKEGFMAVGANCILKRPDGIADPLPKELAETLFRAMWRPCHLANNITYGEDTDRFLRIQNNDIAQSQLGQNWLTTYSVNPDGTINHIFFLLQVSSLPNNEFEVTIFYSEATTPPITPAAKL